ncbi:MAG: WYL domain-containing protein [Deltaproteobacteria bacterium]|nr:WYL domain-containing protein [Deltaproteobacteria bacterium]
MKKDERLLALVTTLLDQSEPVTYGQLSEWFDDYKNCDNPDSALRKFERDKADLKELGVPIQYIEPDEDSVGGYFIDPKDYYLQDPALSSTELALLYLSGRAAVELPEFPLKQELMFALNKIAYGSDAPAEPLKARLGLGIEKGGQDLEEKLKLLTMALLNNKIVRIEYRALSSGENTVRKVEPYGVFMKHGEWYLAGFCRLRKAVRIFKVARIGSLDVNTRAIGTPDFKIPDDFQLQDLAGRPPYCFRVHPPVKVTLWIDPSRPDIRRMFEGTGRMAGENLELESTNSGALLDMIVPLRDGVKIIEPPELIEELLHRLKALRSIHGRKPEPSGTPDNDKKTSKNNSTGIGGKGPGKSHESHSGHPTTPGSSSGSLPGLLPGSLERVRRILTALPKGLKKDGAFLEDEARSLGVTAGQLAKDLQAAMMAGRFPFSPDDLIEVAMNGDKYKVYLEQKLEKPLRLTPEEAFSLIVAARFFKGLENTLDGALEKIESVLDNSGRKKIRDLGRKMQLSSEEGDSSVLDLLEQAIETRRQVLIEYRTGGSGEITKRHFAPYSLLNISGNWYIVGFCALRNNIRILKTDRIIKCLPVNKGFEMPDDFDPDFHRRTLLARNFQGMKAKIRLTGEMALMAKENPAGLDLKEEPGGSIIVTVSGGGLDWLSAWTLARGEDATVLEPEELRQKIVGDIDNALCRY